MISCIKSSIFSSFFKVYEYTADENHYWGTLYEVCPYNSTTNVQPGKQLWSNSSVVYVQFRCFSGNRRKTCLGGGFLANISHVPLYDQGTGLSVNIPSHNR